MTMGFDDDDDDFWDSLVPADDFLGESYDASDDPVEVLGLRRRKHVGTQGTTQRASAFPEPKAPSQPQVPTDSPNYADVDVPDWDESAGADDEESSGRRRRKRSDAGTAAPITPSYHPPTPTPAPVGGGIFDEYEDEPFSWDDPAPLPQPSARTVQASASDPDPFAQYLVPLSSQDLDKLRREIANRPLLYEQLETARNAAERSFNWAPPLGLLLVIAWAAVFGRGLIDRMINADGDSRVERIIRQNDLYADPSEGARLFSIAVGTLDMVLICVVLIAGVAALLNTMFRRSSEQIPLAIVNLGTALLVSAMLLASPRFISAAIFLLVVLLMQKPLRILGRKLFGQKLSRGIRTPHQNAQASQNETLAGSYPQGAVNRPAEADDEPDGLMVRLLDRMRKRGDDNA